jgi:hypothetical protein
LDFQATNCLRTDQKLDNTAGFFVACFEKFEESMEEEKDTIVPEQNNMSPLQSVQNRTQKIDKKQKNKKKPKKSTTPITARHKK